MISVIVPVYKNSANIVALLEALEELNRTLKRSFEVVFVVDGSPDDSALQLARALPAAGFRSQLLNLSRNFGAFQAIRAGLKAASGDCLAVMAADLQEPPELIVEFDRRLRSGEFDIAVGQRLGREDPALSRLSSAMFWRLYRRFIQHEVPPGGVDIFACTGAVRDQLVSLSENNSSLIGLLFWVGFRRTFVPYKRRGRVAGVSAWTFSKKTRYLVDSVFSFSDLPLQLLTRVGVLGLVVSVGLSGVVLASKILGNIAVPGYTATVLLVMFFGALNCFAVGLVGGYVWRTYENTKGRPGHIVVSQERFDPGRAGRSDGDNANEQEHGGKGGEILPAPAGSG